METKLDKEDIKQIKRLIRLEIQRFWYDANFKLMEKIKQDEVEEFGRK